MNYNGTPDRALEWNDKHVRRCAKCKRLGPKEKYKAGPLKIEGGETVRTYVCDPQPCKPPRVDHYQNAHPPKRYDGEDPPRRAFTLRAPRAKRQPGPGFLEKRVAKDLARMEASAKQTSADAQSREGGSDPMKPRTKKQIKRGTGR